MAGSRRETVSDYPRVSEFCCPGDHGCMLLDLGPGAPDLVCEDPNCVYDPLESGPVSPLDEHDAVTHPKHYTNQVRGVEAWDVIKYFPYLRGTAIKYLWRAGDKDDVIQDLRKALAYINKEIEMIEEERAREQHR
jgi:hypothetical protein